MTQNNNFPPSLNGNIPGPTLEGLGSASYFRACFHGPFLIFSSLKSLLLLSSITGFMALKAPRSRLAHSSRQVSPKRNVLPGCENVSFKATLRVISKYCHLLANITLLEGEPRSQFPSPSTLLKGQGLHTI